MRGILLLLALILSISCVSAQLTIINTDDIGKTLNLSNQEIVLGEHKFSVYNNISAISDKTFQAVWLTNSAYKNLTVYISAKRLSNNASISLKGYALIDKYFTKSFNFNLSSPTLTTLPINLTWSYSTTYNVVYNNYSDYDNQVYDEVTGVLISQDETRYVLAERNYTGYTPVTLSAIKNTINLNGYNMSFLDPDTGCGILNTSNIVYTLNQSLNATGSCINIRNVRNLTLDCQGKTINYSRSGVIGYGINLTNVNDTIIKNCIVVEGNTSGANKHAIYSSNSPVNYNLSIVNNTIYTIAGASYGLNVGGIRTNISNNSITTIGISSVGLYGVSSNNTVAYNFINVTNNANGIYTGSLSNYMVIKYNNIFFNRGWGVWFNSPSYAVVQYNNFTITPGYGTAVYITGTFNNTIDSTNLVMGYPLNYTWNCYNTVLQNVDYSTIYGEVIYGNCTNLTINNVTFGNNGLLLSYVTRAVVNNSVFKNVSGHPIIVVGGNTFNATISNNNISSQAEVYVTGANNTIINNWINTSIAYAIQSYGNAYGLIQGNTIYAYNNYAIYFASSIGYMNVRDNHIWTNISIGIRNYNTPYTNFTNNTIDSKYNSIEIDNVGSRGVMIVNNTLFQNFTSGYALIDISSCNSTWVENNTLIAPRNGLGVYLWTNTNNNTIINNHIIINQSTCFQLVNSYNNNISNNECSTLGNAYLFIQANNLNNTNFFNNTWNASGIHVTTTKMFDFISSRLNNITIGDADTIGKVISLNNAINNTFMSQYWNKYANISGLNYTLNLSNQSYNNFLYGVYLVDGKFNTTNNLVVNGSYYLYDGVSVYVDDNNGNPLLNAIVNISNTTNLNINVQNTSSNGRTNITWYLNQYRINNTFTNYTTNFTINVTYDALTQQNRVSNDFGFNFHFENFEFTIGGVTQVIRTMVGSANNWVWGTATSGVSVIRSGTQSNWTWRVYTPSSGRLIPNGTANKWTWINEV